jgi:hypothetical protein
VPVPATRALSQTDVTCCTEVCMHVCMHVMKGTCLDWPDFQVYAQRVLPNKQVCAAQALQFRNSHSWDQRVGGIQRLQSFNKHSVRTLVGAQQTFSDQRSLNAVLSAYLASTCIFLLSPVVCGVPPPPCVRQRRGSCYQQAAKRQILEMRTFWLQLRWQGLSHA